MIDKLYLVSEFRKLGMTLFCGLANVLFFSVIM